LFELPPRDAHQRILPVVEGLQKEKRLAVASRRGVCKSNRQEFNALVYLDPACQTSATKMWLPHAIESLARTSGTGLSVGCWTIHFEARYNHFADVWLAQPEARNNSPQVNR
jgi:hypothetical protein